MSSTQSQGLVAGGALLTVVAAILPWLEPNSSLQELADSGSGGQSLSGIDIFTEGLQPIFSGPVAAVIAILLVVVAVALSGNDWADAVVIVGGAIVALVAALWIIAPGTIIGGGMGGAMVAAFLSPGIGVYLTILGGILILAGGAVSYTSDDDAPAVSV